MTKDSLIHQLAASRKTLNLAHLSNKAGLKYTTLIYKIKSGSSLSEAEENSILEALAPLTFNSDNL